MNYYTKDWKKFIYKDYHEWIKEKLFVEHFLLDFLITDVKEKEKNLKFTENLLIECFNKYYQKKTEYIQSKEELKKKFNNYEEINLLSYDEELNLYKEKLNNYSKKLDKEIKKILATWKNNELPGNIKYQEKLLSRIVDPNNIDSRLIALNQGHYTYEFIYTQLGGIFNEVNGFLTSYKTFLKTLPKKFDIDLMEEIVDIYYDNTAVLDYIFTEKNNKIYGKVVIYNKMSETKYTLTFENVIFFGKEFEMKVNVDKNDCMLWDNSINWIEEFAYGNYIDKPFYLNINGTEFVADNIEVTKEK